MSSMRRIIAKRLSETIARCTCVRMCVLCVCLCFWLCVLSVCVCVCVCGCVVCGCEGVGGWIFVVVCVCACVRVGGTAAEEAMASLEDPSQVETPEVTREEVERAVKKLCNGKAAGGDSIVPELLKTGGTSLID